jgi:hypothetical protein
MSGFLRRVVAAAQKSEGAIHPVLGSVYSRTAAAAMPYQALAGGEDAGAIDEESHALDHYEARAEDAASDRDHGPAAPAAARTRTPTNVERGAPNAAVSRALAETIDSNEIRPPASPQSDASADAAWRPLVSGHRDRRDPAPESARRTAASLEGSVSARPEHSNAAQVRSALRPADGADAGTDAEKSPLHRAPVRALTREEGSMSSAPPSRMPARSDERYARHQGPQVPEAKDVEIHIGRIEVTAAAAPQARPAAAAARRPSPSLDEYLKRRGGRTL